MDPRAPIRGDVEPEGAAMSNDDPYRPNTGGDYGRDRGAYTPPTDDDLPFQRGGYDPRGGYGGRGGGGGGRGRPPITLIISAVVLIALIVAVALYYRAGPRGSNDAPGVIGQPVEEMKAQAPVDAQPVDPEAGIDVYAEAEAPGTPPTFAPPPEVVQPRPEPQETPVTTPARPQTPTRPIPARPIQPAPAGVVTPPTIDPPMDNPSTSPAPPTRSASVQIGAFSTPSLAQSEYSAVVGRFPQLTRGAQRRVQEVTASNGATVYRTTVSGLTPEDARSLCAAIKGSGGDCIVR